MHLWSLFIYILLKEQNRGRGSIECCRELAGPHFCFPSLLCLFSFCAILKMDYLPLTLAVLESSFMGKHITTLKGREKVTRDSAWSTGWILWHASSKVFKISVLCVGEPSRLWAPDTSGVSLKVLGLLLVSSTVPCRTMELPATWDSLTTGKQLTCIW